ncbi:hypothetical protein [Alloalcanivorax xenomutans]|uniref:hypothetical protein n=1 Tax=Alloalcanivorax xenomutans TaxID=1094342 RepID=UPI003BAD20DA
MNTITTQATVAAICFSVRHARKAFQEARGLDQAAHEREIREELRREQASESKTIARAKIAILDFKKDADLSLKVREERGSFFHPQVDMALRRISKNVERLQDLCMKDLPHPLVISHLNTAANFASDFAHFANLGFEVGMAEENLAERFCSFASDMERFHDHLQEFHSRFVNDPAAEFKVMKHDPETIE